MLRDMLLIAATALFTVLITAVWNAEPVQEESKEQKELEPFGFLDFKTGRRKAFDNETGEEYFVD